MKRISGTTMLGIAVIATAVIPILSLSWPAQSAAFEVASIKLRAPLPGTLYRLSTRDYLFGISGTRIVEEFATVTDLLMDAYKVKNYQILGAPDWATQRGDHYDITARATGEVPPSVDQVRLMFQALLAERFQLMLHWETREYSVYELVISKSGPKFRDIPVGAPPESVSQGPKPGTKVLQGPMTLLTQLLSSMVDRPVIDRTGLTGTYEYSTGWARPALNMNLTRPPDPTDPGGSIFTAVEEHLGLKLQPAKGPVEFVVIDSVQKPTEN